MISTVQAVRPVGSLRRAGRWGLIGLELVIAGNGVYGGVGLIRDGMGMPDEWLVGTPFASWLWPGVFLLLVIALPMTAAAVAELRRWRWAYQASMVAAALQLAWIAAQIVVLQRYFFLQPVLFGAGLAVAVLAVISHRGEPLLPHQRAA